jgi:hypothetical protein
MSRSPFRLLLLLAATSLVAGCQMAQRLAALRQVQFAIDRIDGVRLAGVDLSRVVSGQPLSPLEYGAIAAAALTGDAPLDLQLVLRGLNPSANATTAELFAMDWTLLLADRETIGGRLDRRVEFPPGRAVEVPLRASLNLARFFGRDAGDLIDVVRTVVGDRGRPVSIGLRAMPHIGTPFGAIRYPVPITITSQIGGSAY